MFWEDIVSIKPTITSRIVEMMPAKSYSVAVQSSQELWNIFGGIDRRKTSMLVCLPLLYPELDFLRRRVVDTHWGLIDKVNSDGTVRLLVDTAPFGGNGFAMVASQERFGDFVARGLGQSMTVEMPGRVDDNPGIVTSNVWIIDWQIEGRKG
jgi:hypothetical protein